MTQKTTKKKLIFTYNSKRYKLKKKAWLGEKPFFFESTRFWFFF